MQCPHLSGEISGRGLIIVVFYNAIIIVYLVLFRCKMDTLHFGIVWNTKGHNLQMREREEDKIREIHSTHESPYSRNT